MRFECVNCCFSESGSLENEYFRTSKWKYGIVMDISNVTAAEIELAIRKGIEEEDSEIGRIVSNPEQPTFENTLHELDYAGLGLSRAESVLWILLGVKSSPELEAVAEKVMPLLSAHNHKIAYDKRLYARVKAVSRDKQERAGLGKAELKLLDDTCRAFEARGIALSLKKQKRLQEIGLELQRLGLTFRHNALADRESFVLNVKDERQIEGLPQLQKDIAHEEALTRKQDGWTFTLDGPSFGSILRYCSNRSLRHDVWKAASRIGCGRRKTSNIEIVRKIVNLRHEQAAILGRKNFAEVVLRERMARRVTTVNKFLDELCEAYRSAAERELGDLRRFAHDWEGGGFRLHAWDKAYYSRELAKRRFGFDPQELRPYLELNSVIKGVFGLAGSLYGLKFKERPDLPVYHKDVKVFDVFDGDGERMATLYTDFHPRQGKRSGAWMTTFGDQYVDREGRDVRPEVLLAMNLTKPTDGTPSLLSLGEVRTFLHEFGHGLHAILSRCRYRSQSGTNVAWDFVELPSQLMENFASEPKFLHTFAFHYRTGEPLPEALIEKLHKSEQFGAATACMRQLQYGMLDMAYYTLQAPLDEDIIGFEKRAWRKAQVGKAERLRSCMSASFEHIMTGGYAAGYYSYKWAEVLDADAFSVFKEAGVIAPAVAERFRAEVLSKGGSERPEVLYRNFRRRKPSIHALLRRDGIER